MITRSSSRYGDCYWTAPAYECDLRIGVLQLQQMHMKQAESAATRHCCHCIAMRAQPCCCLQTLTGASGIWQPVPVLFMNPQFGC